MGNEVELDHIVVTAPTLKSGVQWVREVLGATPELGGKHERMGTHNCLLRLGERIYLEVIAIDPNAPHPGRPRWFGLDEVSSPRLGAWVARTTDIGASLEACKENLGKVEPMSRGELEWLITVASDGQLPFDGCAPVLIQWQQGMHPAARMRESACRLQRLSLYHPQAERIGSLLDSLGYSATSVELRPVQPDTLPRIEALISTPAGERLLGSAI